MLPEVSRASCPCAREQTAHWSKYFPSIVSILRIVTITTLVSNIDYAIYFLRDRLVNNCVSRNTVSNTLTTPDSFAVFQGERQYRMVGFLDRYHYHADETLSQPAEDFQNTSAPVFETDETISHLSAAMRCSSDGLESAGPQAHSQDGTFW